MEAQAKQEANVSRTLVQAQIQDHQADKQHMHGMEAAQMNNTAKERMQMNGQNARVNSQGTASQGM
jgi:hypothetical protein